MREYIFGCIFISFLSGIALHIAHSSMRDSSKVAVGIVTLLFVASPFLYLFGKIDKLSITIPNISVEMGTEELEKTAEDAFCEGVRLALSDRYGVDKDNFNVFCDGFDSKTLYADRLYVTLGGGGAFLDYRAVKEYLENNLNVGECRVNVDIG